MTRIIKAAREDELDIAIVDLKGYTNGGRYHIFAQGVAPVQISYLGYPEPLAPDILTTNADHVVILAGKGALSRADNVYAAPQPNDSERVTLQSVLP